MIMGDKPRVVFLINSLTGGGAERIMVRLIAHSKSYARSHDLHLVVLDRAPEAYSVPDWIEVHRLGTAGSTGASLVATFRCLRRLEPAVCLSFLTRANLINVICGKLLGYPAVISERVNPSSHHARSLGGVAAGTMTRALYPRADEVICPSEGVAADLVHNFGVHRTKATVIPNPVDADELRRAASQPIAIPTKRPYIVAMGRLVETKNFALLLRAFAQVSPEFDLMLIGDGPLHEELRSLAQQMRLSHRVHFSGFVQNPFPLIVQAHAFVMASNAEGFPNALVEAMALGVPVIATNCRSGPAELLGEESTLEITDLHEAPYGLLVPVRDVAALSAALTMMSDDHFRGQQAVRAAEGAARYQLQPAVDAYWHVLRGAMS